MLAIRKIHLWVGIILSLVLLCEGVTGLILAEPGIVGQAAQSAARPDANQGKVQAEKREMTAGEGDMRQNPAGKNNNPVLMTARTLHEGRIGNLNLRWLVVSSGWGLVILTLTGLYMAIPHLRR